MNTVKANSFRLKVALLLTVFSMFLTGCITERTGGFQPDADEVVVNNYLNVAKAYLRAGEFGKVRQSLATVAEYEPNNSEMFGIWGLLYAQEGDLDVAEDNFERSLRLNSSDSLTRNNYAAFLFSNGEFEEAYEQLEIVVRDVDYEGRAQAFENLGLAALRLGRTVDAEVAFNRALQLNQNMVGPLTELIDIALARQDGPEALRHYSAILTLQQFYSLAPTPRNLLQGIRLAELQGNQGQVIQLARSLADNFPESREYRMYQQSSQ